MSRKVVVDHAAEAKRVRQAVRAYHRIMRPWWANQEEAEAADAGFDGGEWSGPAHARITEHVEEETMRHVAGRFNVPLRAMELEIMRQYHEDFRPVPMQ